MSEPTNSTPTESLSDVPALVPLASATIEGGVNAVQTGIAKLSVNDKENLEDVDDADDDDEIYDNLPKSVVNRLHALKKLQQEADELDVLYKAERIALEKKYKDLKTPLWTKRTGIVAGDIDVEDVTSSTVDDSGAADEELPTKGIPAFWFQALQSHPSISNLITPEDMPALEHLQDIRVEYNEDMSRFDLQFIFGENEFFEDKMLTKAYLVDPDLLDEKAPALVEVNGCEIHWKPKKNLCVTEIRKKQRAKSGKRNGQVRYITQNEPKPSFFHFFSDPMLMEEEDEDEDEEKEKVNHILNIDEDYEIGHCIRTSIIPEAVLWYTGEAAGEEGYDFGDDSYEEGSEEEDDEEDDDEDDDEEEDEESEDVPKPSKAAKGGKAGKGKGWQAAASGAPGSGPSQGDNPECKQN